MLPHQKNKVDISSLSEEEQRLFRLYGKLPSKRDILSNKLKERKYFDSGDYALSKAGKASDVGVTDVGSQHPLPENIPHVHTPPAVAQAGSPGKESAQLHAINKSPLQEDSNEGKGENAEGQKTEEGVKEGGESPVKSPVSKEVPSRWQAQSADE